MENKNYNTAVKLIYDGMRSPLKAKYASVVKEPVADALRIFSGNPEFADAVVAAGRDGFANCLEAIMKDVNGSISDIELYRRAAGFFFPGCGVRMKMEIDLCAGAEGRNDIMPGGKTVDAAEAEIQSTGNAVPDADSGEAEQTSRKISIDLDDLFD